MNYGWGDVAVISKVRSLVEGPSSWSGRKQWTGSLESDYKLIVRCRVIIK